MPNEEKPPIGIMPERIWKQKRAEELTEAIARYVSARDYRNTERTIIAWCHELEGLVRDLEAAQQNMHRTGCKADHDMMLYAGVETCPACGQSTRPPVMPVR